MAGFDEEGSTVLVSAWVPSVELNQGVLSASYTETRDGTGGTRMYMKNSPITAITSVTVDGVVIPARSALGQAGFYLDAVGNCVCATVA